MRQLSAPQACPAARFVLLQMPFGKISLRESLRSKGILSFLKQTSRLESQGRQCFPQMGFFLTTFKVCSQNRAGECDLRVPQPAGKEVSGTQAGGGPAKACHAGMKRAKPSQAPCQVRFSGKPAFLAPSAAGLLATLPPPPHPTAHTSELTPLFPFPEECLRIEMKPLRLGMLRKRKRNVPLTILDQGNPGSSIARAPGAPTFLAFPIPPISPLGCGRPPGASGRPCVASLHQKVSQRHYPSKYGTWGNGPWLHPAKPQHPGASQRLLDAYLETGCWAR